MARPGSTEIGLRDWLAGQALNGLLANEYFTAQPALLKRRENQDFYAQQAYAFADAMLRYREHPQVLTEEPEPELPNVPPDGNPDTE